MIKDFITLGHELQKAGYSVVPIRPGTKRPYGKHWQDSDYVKGMDVCHLAGYGTGILTGVDRNGSAIMGIDIDATDVSLVSAFAVWCYDNLGHAPERIGQPPKLLLPYRAAAPGWKKITGVWLEDLSGDKHRIEILGAGQQFVAYAIHPDTGEPYSWDRDYSDTCGLVSIPAKDLPLVSHEQLIEAVNVFEQMALKHGLTPVITARQVSNAALSRIGEERKKREEDPFESLPVGYNPDETRNLLKWLDNEDYDVWLKVGLALHHEYKGDDIGLGLWQEWSETAANYQNPDDLQHRWVGFVSDGANPLTLRTFIKVSNRVKRESELNERQNLRTSTIENIARCEDSMALLDTVAPAAGKAAEGIPALRAELAGKIQARFKTLTDGTSVPISDVRKAMTGRSLTPAAAPKRVRYERTEFGNMERMIDTYGDALMYTPEISAWYRWTGHVWKRATETYIEYLAKEVVRSLVDDLAKITSDEERESHLKFCAMSQKALMVRHMVQLAASEGRIVVPFHKQDRDPYLLGVGNGAVNLRDGTLLEPDPSLHITITTPIKYDDDAQCPLFEQTVSEVFFDKPDMVDFFQRLIGYSLMGNPREDVLVIPFGTGSNGKSTVLGAIREALGSHAKAANAETFLSTGGPNNAGNAREDILRLRGTRFVYVSEPEEGSELKEGMVKAMTGGDTIPARGLYAKTTVEIRPSWVVFLPTNHKPIIKGDDYGIWRRMLLIPFTRNFDKDLTVDKDAKRADKLRKELPGILRWCIEGALAYQQQQGLNPPKAIRAARENYRSDMDLLRDWLDECCTTAAGEIATNADLWSSWQLWAREHGEFKYISTSRALGRRLSQRFEPIRDSHGIRGRGILGISVDLTGDFDDD